MIMKLLLLFLLIKIEHRMREISKDQLCSGLAYKEQGEPSQIPASAFPDKPDACISYATPDRDKQYPVGRWIAGVRTCSGSLIEYIVGQR
jgi:hypothetical protein